MTDATSVIHSFSGEYRFLSNFEYAPVEYDGAEYPTVEHAYQAAKTLDPCERYTIQHAANAGAAKRLGRRVTLRPDWNDIKLDVMRGLLRQKFANSWLRARLLATGSATLIEGNTWGDTYWGQVNGVGHNWLGVLLMRVRAELHIQAMQASNRI